MVPCVLQGLAVVNGWGNLRYVANEALMGLLHNKLYPASVNQRREQVYACFARKQMRYILGDGGRSYVVGVGAGQTPCQVHHRAASCGPLNVPCDCLAYNNPGCNPNTIYGALVSGPTAQDTYTDARSNYQQTEVAVDFNAGFSGRHPSATRASHSSRQHALSLSSRQAVHGDAVTQHSSFVLQT